MMETKEFQVSPPEGLRNRRASGISSSQSLKGRKGPMTQLEDPQAESEVSSAQPFFLFRPSRD